jgi:hypothetical protein
MSLERRILAVLAFVAKREPIPYHLGTAAVVAEEARYIETVDEDDRSLPSDLGSIHTAPMRLTADGAMARRDGVLLCGGVS